MKTRLYPIMLAILVTSIPVLLSSCSKDSSTNPSSPQAGLKIQAVNTAYRLPVAVSGGATSIFPTVDMAYVNWTTGTMVVSSVTYEITPAKTGSVAPEVENQWVGPEMVNLFDLSGTTLGKITIPRGVYQEIEFKVFANKKDAGAEPVMSLSGTYTSATGKSIPLSVIITDDVYLKAERLNVTVNNNVTDFSPLIQIYLDRLFSNILPSQIDHAVLTNGQIIISATSNADIYQIVMKNFMGSGAWRTLDD